MSSGSVGYVFDAHVWNEQYNILLLVHTVPAVNLRTISNSILLFMGIVTFGQSH
jgi:hypothetical protein